MLPRVSITTVLYNSADYLKSCFASVTADAKSNFAELIAVDNASPDNSAEIVKTEFPFAQLISSNENLGFAKACNLAWNRVKGDYWLLLNPDAVIPKGGLQQLIEWMDNHPNVGVASPDIVDVQGKSAYPGRRFPAISLTLLEMLRLHLLLPQNLRSKILQGTYWKGGDQLDVDWVPGTAMLVRRKAVEQVGLLSKELFMYGEDIEWCWRIRKEGWKIGVCNSVKVLHQGGTSAKQTWGNEETNLRMYRAIYKAVKMMRGDMYSKLLLLLDSVALLIEGYHPSRSKTQRAVIKNIFKAHLAVLTCKEQIPSK